jgi:hypothetical protein
MCYYRQRYERECTKLGIEGNNVKKELLKRSEVHIECVRYVFLMCS